jgi:hypothetical protein
MPAAQSIIFPCNEVTHNPRSPGDPAGLCADGGANMRYMVCVACLLLLLTGAIAVPAAARSPGIEDIEPGDTVFVYEENLNLSQLRDPVSGNPVTSLRRYVDDDPTKALISEIPVADDTSVDIPALLVESTPAVYYAYNSADGAGASVVIRKPEITLGVTLANPYHADEVEGLNLPEGTAIAFRVDSPHVGTNYRADSDYPARIDIVVTTPGGAETTTFGGVDLSDIPVSASRIYTDDIRAPVSLSGLQEGTYRIRAEWREPQAFADNAPDSNEITFSLARRGVDITVTATHTPTATETPAPSPSPTVAPTTPPPTAPVTTAPTASPTVAETPSVPATTAAPAPSPTPAPLSMGAVLLALCVAAALVVWRNGRI